MWLSKRAGRQDQPETAAISTVTISGERIAALSGGETRGMRTVAPAGIIWRPRVGQEVLVVKCGAEGDFVAGAVQSGAGGLDSGDVAIDTGAARIRVRANGCIELSGNVSITGTLAVNGNAVGGG